MRREREGAGFFVNLNKKRPGNKWLNMLTALIRQKKKRNINSK